MERKQPEDYWFENGEVVKTKEEKSFIEFLLQQGYKQGSIPERDEEVK